MKRQELQARHHCVYAIHYHLVLVTKYRRRVLTAAMLSRIKAIVNRLAIQWGIGVLEFNGEPDHVHFLLTMTPTVQPSTVINNLKTVTSRLIRKEFPTHVQRYYRRPVLWSRSYCLLSCGGAPLSVIKRYIEQQAGAD